MTDTAEPEAAAPDGDDESTARPTWPKILIFGAGTLAVLLLGATIGMLLTQARDGAPEDVVPSSESIDVGFAQDMSVHHLQAVTMANIARDRSRDSRVRSFAFDVASTQLEQVGRMKGWLMLWDQPEQAVGDYMTWMPEASGHGHGASADAASAGDAPMPGMATTAELAKLRSLSGRPFDVYFLQLMLRHHQGGVEMAEFAKRRGSLHAVRTLAASMLASQGPEMTLMRQYLAERNAEPLPFP